MGGGGGNFVSDVTDSISDGVSDAYKTVNKAGQDIADAAKDYGKFSEELIKDPKGTLTDATKSVYEGLGVNTEATGLKYIGDWATDYAKSAANAVTFGLSGDLLEDGKLDKNFGELAKSAGVGVGDMLTGGSVTGLPKIMEDQAMKAQRSAEEQARRDIEEFEKLNRPFYDPVGLESRRQRLQRGMYGFSDTMLTGNSTLGSAKGASTRTGG